MQSRQSAQQDPGYRQVPGYLRQLREEADLTQRELGKRVGKPQSWVQNCETGSRRIDIREFIAWAQACDISPKVALNRLLVVMGDQSRN